MKRYIRKFEEKDAIEARALTIAARIMATVGLCRYDSAAKCHKVRTDETACDKCIRSWLVAKAKKELEGEKKK